MPALDFHKIKNWLEGVAAAHEKKVGNLNYLFCDDKCILETNLKFLNHDYYTDIITFDYSYKNRVSGDIFISLETVKSNAEKFSENYQRELLRVIVHGLLHLCGINDKAPGEREIMEREEDKALIAYEI